MRLFKTKSFIRFARRERISDASLREAVQRAERGLVDAELGGVIKQRVARPGQGRSGGYRVLPAYRVNTLSVFLYGFAKNERDNIDGDELATSPEDGFKPTQQRSRERLRTVWYRRSSMANKKTASRLAKAMLETATDMHNSGVLDQATYDKITMRHLGSNVPKAMPVTAAQIRAIRERANMSQAVFARHLNLTVGYVSQLERGTKQPTGAALALLNIIKRKGMEAIS